MITNEPKFQKPTTNRSDQAIIHGLRPGATIITLLTNYIVPRLIKTYSLYLYTVMFWFNGN